MEVWRGRKGGVGENSRGCEDMEQQRMTDVHCLQEESDEGATAEVRFLIRCILASHPRE